MDPVQRDPCSKATVESLGRYSDHLVVVSAKPACHFQGYYVSYLPGYLVRLIESLDRRSQMPTLLLAQSLVGLERHFSSNSEAPILQMTSYNVSPYRVALLSQTRCTRTRLSIDNLGDKMFQPIRPVDISQPKSTRILLRLVKRNLSHLVAIPLSVAILSDSASYGAVRKKG
jgi:hypothetical protein